MWSWNPRSVSPRWSASSSVPPGITLPGESGRRGFGPSALRVNGSIFAMLSHDRLVVKLPKDRAAGLIGNGIGGPFDAGKGRPMAEWLTVVTTDDETRRTLAGEALDYVTSHSKVH
jgi:hypothetical protein